jgi:myo-inositol-1(or 4)-monophosphatase
MKSEEAERLALLILNTARRAGAHAMNGYRKPKVVEKKGVIDLVTDFDKSTEAFIREELARLAPGIDIIAEESGGQSSSDRICFVDPIDGTSNYVHGHPFWCVSIGLVVRGIPVAGAVVAPALNCEWLGWFGGPALRNHEKCAVSSVSEFGNAFLATGFPYDRQTSPDNNFDAFVALKKKCQGIRRCGSAAIDLCLVADGTYDGFWEKKLHAWDLAAGIAILNAAGGKVTSFEGSHPDIASGNVVASNGLIHDAFLRELRRSRNPSSVLPPPNV